MRNAKTTLTLAAGLSVAGCCTPVPDVAKSIRCEPDAGLLATRCADPKSLPSDATFQTLVDTALSDRKALTECGLTVRALQDSIKACQQAVDEHNSKIDEINTQNKK